MRRRGVGTGGEGCSVPGRIARAVAEFTERGRLDQSGGGGRPALREAFECASIEAGGGRGRRRKLRQAGQLTEGVEHGHPEGRVATGERRPVVEQNLAQAHECVVDVADHGLGGFLVAGDRLDQVPAEGPGGHGHSRQPDLHQAVRDSVEAGPSGADHEHALVLRDERADRVHDRLRAAGAGESFHDERVAGRDLRDDVLLLGVGVEQQGVGGRRPGVLADRDDRAVRRLDAAARVAVAADRVEQRLVQAGRVGGEGAAHVGEGGGHEAGHHVEPGQV